MFQTKSWGNKRPISLWSKKNIRYIALKFYKGQLQCHNLRNNLHNFSALNFFSLKLNKNIFNFGSVLFFKLQSNHMAH